MFCNFINQAEGYFTCVNCGITLFSTDGMPPVFICKYNHIKQSTESMPSFLDRIKNFAKATVDHISSGAKLASDDTIEQRYNTCKKCDFFINETCSQCGCPIFAAKKYVSKLSWAEQECPIGKWKKEETTS